ncbi:hypothetical protein RND81_10G144700 [Saponaria officinalis]|uniref:Uncharacterized protein n=1 Tax=Saponaria officinalis TaxID=3572 RepID=A0AAW1I4M0_SAPOF
MAKFNLSMSFLFFIMFLSLNFDISCANCWCGMGTCRNLTAFPYYQCLCLPGWSQFFGNKSAAQANVPCVFPRCTYNDTCENSDEKEQQLHRLRPQDYGDDQGDSICSADNSICGEGSCKSSKSQFAETSPYTCICREGTSNLMGNSSLPCFSSCTFGDNCSSLHGNSNDNRNGNDTSPGPSGNSEKGQAANTPVLNIVLLLPFILFLAL